MFKKTLGILFASLCVASFAWADKPKPKPVIYCVDSYHASISGCEEELALRVSEKFLETFPPKKYAIVAYTNLIRLPSKPEDIFVQTVDVGISRLENGFPTVPRSTMSRHKTGKWYDSQAYVKETREDTVRFMADTVSELVHECEFRQWCFMAWPGQTR